jgi:WhiB family redox-sensing transcriptional regulator
MNRRAALAFSPGAAGPLLAEARPDLPWQARGLCAQTDPEAFFPEPGAPNWRAKRVCRSCPVRRECLSFAVDNGEEYGIWGGLSAHERRQVAPPAADMPAERRCMKGLHAMTPENTIGSGSCRACRKAADRARHRRQAREALSAAA